MAKRAEYHPDESYALNVMRQMYATQLKDVPNLGDLEASSTLGTDVTLSTLTYLSARAPSSGPSGSTSDSRFSPSLGKRNLRI